MPAGVGYPKKANSPKDAAGDAPEMAEMADAAAAGAAAGAAEAGAEAAMDDAAMAADAPMSSNPDAQMLMSALAVDEATAMRLMDAAAMYPETQEMDAAALADALSRDHMLYSKLLEHGARPEGGDSAGELFALA